MPDTNDSSLINENVNENLKKLNPMLLPLPWLLVIAFVIIFVVLKYSGNVEELIETKQAEKEFPQVFMTNVDMREFAADGTLHFQLKTPLIRHFQIGDKNGTDDYTLFDLPQIVFLGSEEKPAWYMTAEVGRNDNNGELFTLSTNVLAQQVSKTQGTISISTSELQLNTRDQFAETDKAVTMRSAKTHLETVGMRAFIKQDQIELLSQVTGTYAP